MQNYENIKGVNNLDDEIDIQNLLKIIWAGWKKILTIIIIFSIVAVSISLYLPNIYQSKALLTPSGQQSSSMDSMSGIGGLANLAGISLSSQPSDNSTKALKSLKPSAFMRIIFCQTYFFLT